MLFVTVVEIHECSIMFNNDQSLLNDSLNYLINFNAASVLFLTLCRMDPYRSPTVLI